MTDLPPILEFDSLCNDDTWIISVPDRSWATRLRAVKLIIDQSSEIGFYDWYDYFEETFPWWVTYGIATAGHFGYLRKHELPPWKEDRDDDSDCGCEDEGWWCPDAPGPTHDFFFIDRSLVRYLEEKLCHRMWELDEEYC